MTYMGESGSPLLDHFSNLSNKSVPEQCNPADFCLSVLATMSPNDAKAAFDASDLNTALVNSMHNEIDRGRLTGPPSIESERPNSPLSEVWLLTKRHTIVKCGS